MVSNFQHYYRERCPPLNESSYSNMQTTLTNGYLIGTYATKQLFN